MPFSQETLSVLALAGVGLALAAGLATAVLAARLARLSRSQASLGRGGAGRDAAGGARGGEVPGPFGEGAGSEREELDEMRRRTESALQHVGLVRYDAFEDMGGRLSFSAALLDASGRGVVLTTINGRTESRVYAKPVEGGASRYNLSEEEQEAIRRALARRG